MIRGRYTIEGILGQGNFGTVYKAFDHQSNRPVALKMATPEPGSSSSEVKQQFTREAEVLARLKHPGICAIFDYFELSGNLWLAMELIPGKDLQEWKAALLKPLIEQELLDLALAALDILDYLHSQDPPIVHRDLKPPNFRVTPENRLVLVDFGIARPRSQGQSDTMVIGTEGYAAPEQYRGYSQPASDLYAWAATMNWLATGVSPQAGSPAFAPLNESRPDLSESFCNCLEQCKALLPDERLSASAASEMLRARGGGPVVERQIIGCPHCNATAPVSVLQCCTLCQLGRDLAGATASEWADRGVELARQNLWRQALAHLQRARTSGHSSQPALLSLGRCLAKTGDIDGALDLLRKLPDGPRVLVERARLLVERKDKPGALALLRGCESPLTSGFYAGLNGRLDVLERICKLHPGEFLLGLLLSRLQERKDPDLALITLDKILLGSPHEADIHRGRIRLLLAQGRFKDCWVAVHALRRIAAHDPVIFKTLSLLYGREDAWGQALTSIQTYLSVKPDDLDAQFELGAILEKTGRSVEAIAVYRSLAVGQRRPEALKELTRALVALGQVEEAVGIGQLLAEDVQDPEVWIIYARALELTGQADLARQWSERAAAEPGQPQVKSTLPDYRHPSHKPGAARESPALACWDLNEPTVRKAVVHLYMAVILADRLVKQSELTALMAYFARSLLMDDHFQSEINVLVAEAQEIELSDSFPDVLAFLSSQAPEVRDELYSTCVEIAFADDEIVDEERETLSAVAAAFQIAATYQERHLETQKRLSDARLKEYRERREGRYTQESRVEFSADK